MKADRILALSVAVAVLAIASSASAEEPSGESDSGAWTEPYKTKTPAEQNEWPVVAGKTLADQIERKNYSIEWFGWRVAGGGYGGGLELSLFTFRWKYFVLDLVRAGGVGVGPGIGGGRAGYALWAGTMFGFPFFLDQGHRHEMRIGTGLFGGRMEDYESYGNGVPTLHRSWGPYILFEISYLYRIVPNASFEVGIQTLVPTMGEFGGTPDMLLNGFVGFRI